MVTVALQAVPGGDRVGRLVGIKVDSRLARRRQIQEAQAEIASAETGDINVALEIAADMGVDEARVIDI